MDQHYNQNYTKKEIDEILSIIKECVKNEEYTISLNSNRQDNINFINEYNIRSDKQKSILMKIEANDFCHSLKNLNPRYSDEILYVFVPKEKLFNAGGHEDSVRIYTKFNIIKTNNSKKTVIVSFHKANKQVEYLFN